MYGTVNWEEPMLEQIEQDWLKWRMYLKELENVTMPQTYSSILFSDSVNCELHIICDASKEDIDSIYLKLFDIKVLRIYVCAYTFDPVSCPRLSKTIVIFLRL